MSSNNDTDLTQLERIAAQREAREAAAQRQQAIERGVPPDPADRNAMEQAIAQGDLEPGRAEVVDQNAGGPVETASVDTNERVTESGDVELREGIANEGDFSPDPNRIRSREQQAQAESGAADLREQTGREDIQVDDVTVVEEDGRPQRIETNQSFAEEQAAEAVNERVGTGLTEEDVVRRVRDDPGSDAPNVALTDEGEREVARAREPPTGGPQATRTTVEEGDRLRDVADTPTPLERDARSGGLTESAFSEADVPPTGAFGQTTAASAPDGTNQSTLPADGKMGPIESALQPVIGPPGEFEQTVGGAVEGAAQPVIGPPGEFERAAGGAAFGLGDVSADAAGFAGETVVDPAADAAGAGVALGAETVAAPADLVGADDAAADIRGAADVVEGATTKTVEGVGDAATDLIAAPETAVQTGQLFREGAEFTAEAVSEEGVDRGTEAAVDAGVAVGTAAAGAAATQAASNPFRTAGGIAGGFLTGAAAGRAAGVVGRGLRDRVRTAGGTRVDAEDLVNGDVLAGSERFPSAQDPDLFQSDPAAAVRQQADEFTPAAIDDAFAEAGVTDGTTVKKALDVEPEGPGGGRAAQGFEVPEADSPEGQAFESPGAFVGPELSPNFLRLNSRAEFSLRPGLPDTGGRPTTAAVRTDVENPDADDLAGFNRELVDREGETTAVTKPPSEVNPGEIEAVIPPGAEFADVGSGPFRDILRRFGVGADFYTEVGGRRVPVRTVAPESELDAPGSRAPGDLFDDDRAQLGAGGGGSRVTRSADDLSRPVEQPVDRPLPVPPSAPGGAGEATPPAGTGTGVSSRPPETETPPRSTVGPGSLDDSPPGSQLFEERDPFRVFERADSPAVTGGGTAASDGRETPPSDVGTSPPPSGVGVTGGESTPTSPPSEPGVAVPGDPFQAPPSDPASPPGPSTPPGSPADPPSTPGATVPSSSGVASPADPVGSPVAPFLTPETLPSEPQQRPRFGEGRGDPDRELVEPAARAPATTLFRNPIAGVFAGVGADPFGGASQGGLPDTTPTPEPERSGSTAPVETFGPFGETAETFGPFGEGL